MKYRAIISQRVFSEGILEAENNDEAYSIAYSEYEKGRFVPIDDYAHGYDDDIRIILLREATKEEKAGL
jgi:hypothetical protein